MKKRFSNNKGFSLVELIIVVAIMAILIGILAPQYMKYVEKSRLNADRDTIDEVAKACETIVTDPDLSKSEPFGITLSCQGSTSVTDTDLVGLIGSTVKLNSKTLSGTVQVNASTTNGIQITYNNQTYTSAADLK